MASPPTAILDCGASRTALGVFSPGKAGALRVERWDVEPIGAVPLPEDVWIRQTGAAGAALSKRLGVRGPVVVVLPGHWVLVKGLKLPPMEPTKRAKVVLFEAERAIPAALSEVVWGHAVTGETEREMEGVLCAVRRSAVEALCAAVAEAGLVPQAVVPGPLALLAAYRATQPTDAPPTGVLEIGARSTTLALIDGQRVHLRVLPFGGPALARAGEAAKSPSRAAAEDTSALASLAARLASEVTRSLAHWQRQGEAEATRPVRWLIAGGGAQTAGLSAALAARLGGPVGAFDPWAGLERGRVAAPESGARGGAGLGAALRGGAVLQSARNPLALDLLPPRWQAAERARRRRPWWLAAAAVVAVTPLPPLAHYRSVERDLRAQVAAVESEIAPLRARERAHRAGLDRLSELARQIGELQDLHDRRTGWLRFLADLQDRLGQVEDVWLERLQLTPAAAEPGGAPWRLAVSGRMLDRAHPLTPASPAAHRRATELLERLAQSPFVAAFEQERFDATQPGILQFHFVVVTHPSRPL